MRAVLALALALLAVSSVSAGSVQFFNALSSSDRFLVVKLSVNGTESTLFASIGQNSSDIAVNVASGAGVVSVFEVNTTSTTPLATQTLTISPNSAHTVGAFGSIAAVQLALYTDDNSSPAVSSGNLRFINAVSGTSMRVLFNGNGAFGNLAFTYTEASNYQNLPATNGGLNVTVALANNSTADIATGISVDNQIVATIVAVKDAQNNFGSFIVVGRAGTPIIPGTTAPSGDAVRASASWMGMCIAAVLALIATAAF